MLEAITAREPANWRAWRMLGTAYQAHQGDRQGAGGVPQGAGDRTGFAAGALQHRHRVRDEAGRHRARSNGWARAKATRKLDMTQIESDPNLSSLKADPRFHALLPTPADFAQPFVETVKVDPRVGWRGGQRSVRLDRARRRRRRPRRRARHRHVGADQGDRRRRGGPRLRLLDQDAAGCCGASTASRAINSAPASRPPATPTATAFPT